MVVLNVSGDLTLSVLLKRRMTIPDPPLPPLVLLAVLAPPPPPEPPKAPLPEPESTTGEVNAKVKRSKERKARSQYSRGTGQLRIPKTGGLNAPTGGPAGGINTAQ